VSLQANIDLVVGNARLAGDIAVALTVGMGDSTA
jgi:pseudouridine-5'-phosphate glycosidase